jgi:uncharacterized protein (DUF58 family)
MAGVSPAAPGRLRTILGSLTPRGRGFLGAAVVALVVGEVLGERDLLRIAVLLAALPLFALAVVARTRYRVRLTRTLTPGRVEAGRDARVLLHLENLSRLPTGTLLMEDTLPYALGGRPRFVLRRVENAGVREATYTVRTEVRGRFVIGPLTVRLTDPFGCAELGRSFSSTEELLVTPVVWRLPAVRLGGDWIGGGEGRATHIAVTGEADASIREYREGDDLRRIHWRTSARTGELMVRRDEQPRQQRGALLLDSRTAAHRGEGPTSSFEWAVSAAASIGLWLTRQGYGLRLVTSEGRSVAGSSPVVAEPLLLDALSVLGPGRSTSLHPAFGPLGSGTDGRGGLLVAVLGLLEDGELAELAALAPVRATAVAVLLDTPSWTGGTAQPPDSRVERARQVLAVAGWRVVVARAGDQLAELWPELGRRGGRTFSVGATVGTAGSDTPTPYDDADADAIDPLLLGADTGWDR